MRNGKLIFKIAPLHHHFELRLSSRIIADSFCADLALLALTTLKLR